MSNFINDNFDGYSYTKDLLPCPFCGLDTRSPPYIRLEEDKRYQAGLYYSVSCTNCGCEPFSAAETIGMAITFWNTRKLQDPNIDFIQGFHAAKEAFIEILNDLNIKKK